MNGWMDKLDFKNNIYFCACYQNEMAVEIRTITVVRIFSLLFQNTCCSKLLVEFKYLYIKNNNLFFRLLLNNIFTSAYG